MTRWTPETADQIGNALIVAQNALTGYAQLSNAPETEEHHQLAQDALDAVREAIRAEGILEQQGIVEPAPGIAVNDTVRLTEDYLSAHNAHTRFRPFANGHVVDLHDGFAEVDWNDQFIPRQVRIEDLEKVVRKSPAAGWVNKAGGFEVGDRVCLKASHLRSTGQTTGEAGFHRGKIIELKPLGEVTLATIEWADGTMQKAATANLSKIKKRGIADE